MNCRLTVFCKSDLATGFRLAGINADSVATAADLEPVLYDKLRQKLHEVVIIDDEMKAGLSAECKERLQESLLPLFVYLPLTSKRGTMDLKRYVHDYVSDLIQAAVGKKLAIPM
ncbi:hypothetical protein BVX99_02950 [bacterium F16]|nr:hypothetical protein BVX99_02950 [bacterium F16]